MKKDSCEEDSDEGPSLYDRKEKLLASNYKVNPGYSMLALEKILEASNHYTDYLKKSNNKKKPSLYIS